MKKYLLFNLLLVVTTLQISGQSLNTRAHWTSDEDLHDEGEIYWDITDSILTIWGTGGIGPYSYYQNKTTAPWRDLSDSFKRIRIKDSITIVGQDAFSGIGNITNVELPNSLIKINSYAFFHSYSLTNINIPVNITRIGERSFEGCPLSVVNVYWNTPISDVKISSFSSYSTATLIVPAGTKTLYEAAPVWQDFGLIIEREPAIPATSISISPKNTTLVAGSALQFVATVAPANATNKDVIWSSSNDAVASVDSSGKVNAIASGTTTITATTVDGGFVATSNVTVFEINAISITLNTTADSVSIGDSLQLIATINPTYASNKSIVWSSSNDAVATVDTTGKIIGVSEGTAVITATTNNGLTATCTITVYQKINNVSLSIPLKNIGQSIIFEFDIPAGGSVISSFALTLPEGLEVETSGIILTESLNEGLIVTSTPLGNNVWLFEVCQPIVLHNAVVTPTNMTYRISGSLANTYEITSRGSIDLSVSEATIPAYEVIAKNSATANVQIENIIYAFIANKMLTIDTQNNETIKMYSTSGKLVFTTDKTEGKISYSVANLPNGMYIVSSNKGWSAKVLKK